MISLLRMLQVSNYLDILYVYFADIVEWNRAQPAPFCVTLNLSSWGGGQNRKNCDYAQTRRAVEPPFQVCILVCIRKGIAFIPPRHVCTFRVSGLVTRFPPFLLSPSVRSFPHFNMFLARFLHFLELIEPPTMI